MGHETVEPRYDRSRAILLQGLFIDPPQSIAVRTEDHCFAVGGPTEGLVPGFAERELLRSLNTGSVIFQCSDMNCAAFCRLDECEAFAICGDRSPIQNETRPIRQRARLFDRPAGTRVNPHLPIV